MPCTAVQAAAPSGGPAEEEGVSPIALSNWLQTCLHSMAPPPESGATPLRPEAAARLLLAAHHPSTTMARARTDSVWCATYTSVLLTWDVSHIECKRRCLTLRAEHHWGSVTLMLGSLCCLVPEGAACVNEWEAWPVR